MKKLEPSNKGRAVGQMKPFTPRQVRTLKEILRNRELYGDLALFSFAIDTSLREGDVVSFLVEDITDNRGEVKEFFYLKQKKTKKPQKLRISKETMKFLKDYIVRSRKYYDDYLFEGQDKNKPMTTRTLRNRVKRWAEYLGLDPKQYSGHSLRRTMAVYLFKKTNNIVLVKETLGHSSVACTASYVGVDKEMALDILGDSFIEG